jgi:chromosome segregation ATPase
MEEWLTDRTAETGDSRETVLARAVASYRLLAENEDEDDALETALSDLEARIDALESETDVDRIEELEAELDEHVEDLRSRIVDVVKEARSRAPAEHSHEEFDRLTEIEDGYEAVDSRLDELETETTALSDGIEARLDETEGDVESVSESVETLEAKADRLAGAVVDLRRRLKRVESHVTHQTALAKLLETAAREDIEKAKCDNCNEMVRLGLLVEPACPHCRSAFDGIEPGSMFFNSAWLTIADRPALEAGSTTEEPFDTDTESQPVTDDPATQDTR